MIPYVVSTLGLMTIAAICFSIPLFLKYHVFRPFKNYVISGDVVTVKDRFSSTWCQSFLLESEARFESLAYEEKDNSSLQVDEQHIQRTKLYTKFELQNKVMDYWGLYLLKGSKVDIYACSHFMRVAVTAIKGYGDLEQCMQEHRKKMNRDEALANAPKESESEETGEDTSSISSSQGAVVLDDYKPFKCSTSLQLQEIKYSYSCRRAFNKLHLQPALRQSIPESGFYYFLFASRSILGFVPNQVSVKFVVDRTQYDPINSFANCSSMSTSCELPTVLGSRPKVVVQMEAVNGTLKTQVLLAKCKPRETLFFIFYALFFIIIFLCAFH